MEEFGTRPKNCPSHVSQRTERLDETRIIALSTDGLRAGQSEFDLEETNLRVRHRLYPNKT